MLYSLPSGPGFDPGIPPLVLSGPLSGSVTAAPVGNAVPSRVSIIPGCRFGFNPAPAQGLCPLVYIMGSIRHTRSAGFNQRLRSAG